MLLRFLPKCYKTIQLLNTISFTPYILILKNSPLSRRSFCVILLTVTEAVVNLDITTQGIQAMATCKLKVLLADRLSRCEQSAEGVEC